MRTPQLATRSVMFMAVPLLLVGIAGWVAPVTAAAARAGSPGPAASFTIGGRLNGVAATSVASAWAVGYAGTPSSHKTLIARWNGTAWTRVPSPSPARSTLTGVAATSASNAWAGGGYGSESSPKTLILQWNGTVWK